jgi:autotransporter-associated beta strand protein
VLLAPPNGTGGLTLSTYAFAVVPGGKWTGGSGTAWHSPDNWSSAMTPGPDFTAVLDGPPAANQPVLSGDGSAKALVFKTAGWIIGTDASHTLDVGTGGISSAGSGINAIDPTVNFTGPAAVSVGPDNTLVLAAVTAGNNLLTKSGAGALVLAGANVCSGGTAVSEGTLRVTNTSGSGTGTGPVTVGAATLGGTGFINGPVTLTGDSTLTSTGTLTINILTVQGLANQIAGGTIWTTGDVIIDPGAVFIINGTLGSETGVLHVRGTLMGKGTIGIPVSIEAGGVISPGSPSTIQTRAQVLNAEGAKHFSFEIGGPTPLYAKPANSLNDVIRLTDAALPFANAAGDAPARLAPSSLIDVYFLFNDPPQGQYKAQFFAGTDFTDAIRDATFKYWLLDPRGTCLHNGNFFSPLDPSLVDWSVVPETADFAGAIATGYITQFTVAPEPATLALLAAGSLLLLRRRWQAFSARCFTRGGPFRRVTPSSFGQTAAPQS